MTAACRRHSFVTLGSYLYVWIINCRPTQPYPKHLTDRKAHNAHPFRGPRALIFGTSVDGTGPAIPFAVSRSTPLLSSPSPSAGPERKRSIAAVAERKVVGLGKGGSRRTWLRWWGASSARSKRRASAVSSNISATRVTRQSCSLSNPSPCFFSLLRPSKGDFSGRNPKRAILGCSYVIVLDSHTLIRSILAFVSSLNRGVSLPMR